MAGTVQLLSADRPPSHQLWGGHNRVQSLKPWLPLREARRARSVAHGTIIWQPSLPLPRARRTLQHTDRPRLTSPSKRRVRPAEPVLTGHCSARGANRRPGWKALNLTAASQGGARARFQTEVVSSYPMSLMMCPLHQVTLRTQVKAPSALTSGLGHLLNAWFRSRRYCWKKVVTYFGGYCPNLCVLFRVPLLFRWPLPPMQPESH